MYAQLALEVDVAAFLLNRYFSLRKQTGAKGIFWDEQFEDIGISHTSGPVLAYAISGENPPGDIIQKYLVTLIDAKFKKFDRLVATLNPTVIQFPVAWTTEERGELVSLLERIKKTREYLVSFGFDFSKAESKHQYPSRIDFIRKSVEPENFLPIVAAIDWGSVAFRDRLVQIFERSGFLGLNQEMDDILPRLNGQDHSATMKRPIHDEWQMQKLINKLMKIRR